MESIGSYPCHNVSFFTCEHVVTVPFFAGVIFMFLRLLLTIFVLTISFTHIGDDSFKWYTVHLYMPFLPFEILIFFRNISQISGYFHEPLLNFKRFSFFAWLFQYFAILVEYQYAIMATFIVFVTYLPYVRPVFYRVWFVGRTWTRYFLIMHMLSYSLTSTFIGTEIAIYLQQLSIVTRITRTFVSITDLALSVLLFLLTALAIYAIVKYKGAKASVADPQRVMEQQRRRLISLVIYSGLPNLLNIPSIITAFFAIAQQFDAKISIMTTVDDIAEELDIYVHSFRTIVLSVCTLVAFAPYRTAMMRIFRRGANSTVKSMKMVIYNGSNQRQPTTMKPPSISIVQPAQLERR